MKRVTKFFFATMRLTVFVAACAAVIGYIDYRVARASVMERLVGIGQRMAPYLDDARGTEAPRRIRINGVQLFTAVGTTDHPPSFVRRFYEDRYAAKGDELAAFADQLRKRGALPPELTALNAASFGNDEQGGVAALDFGGPLTLSSLRERAVKFGTTHNAGDLGRLRYVYWERDRSSTGGTRFITIWTDDNFQIDKLMPVGSADAEGSDLDDVPRYPGTQRVLSADESGQPQRIVVYSGKTGSPIAAELFYRARMAELGWVVDETFFTIAQKSGSRALRFENKKGHEVVIDLSDDKPGQGVTIVALQSR